MQEATFESGPVEGYVGEGLKISFGSTSLCKRMIKDGRSLFVKQLRPEFLNKEQYRIAFRKEYELGRQLHSEYFPTYYSIHEDDESLSLQMENIEGETLQEKLTSSPAYFRDRRKLMSFLRQFMEAVGYLHRQRIVHADLHPSNIIITRIGENLRILDLGYCYTDAFLTTTGGTKGFSAPETVLDARSDIYSIGCVIDYIDKNSEGGIPKRIRKMGRKCRQEAPSMRYQSTDEILRYLDYTPIFRRWTTYAVLAVLLMPMAYMAYKIWKPYDFSYFDYYNTSTTYYNIINEDSLWVEVTGSDNSQMAPEIGLSLNPTVTHRGRTYQVRTIADYAFRHDSILLVTLPAGIRSIGEQAFDHCERLVTLNIPEGVDSIANSAMSNCLSLTNVNLPSTLRYIGRSAFVDDKIRRIVIPDGVRMLLMDTFVGCRELEEVTLPAELEVISRGVFYECNSLKTITIPEKVREIGEYSFSGCTALTDIYMLPLTPPKATAVTKETPLIHVRPEALEAYQKDLYWKGFDIVGDL